MRSASATAAVARAKEAPAVRRRIRRRWTRLKGKSEQVMAIEIKRFLLSRLHFLTNGTALCAVFLTPEDVE
jgi:hypothetical protein